jgi:hypothetical protein
VCIFLFAKDANDNALTQAAIDSILCQFDRAGKNADTRVLYLDGGTNSAPSATGATATATISPYYGHGANAVKELYAKTVCLSVNLTNDTSDYFYNNDFRQLGIVKNPLDDEMDNFRADTGTTCYVITVDDTTAYSNDDSISTDGGGRFIVAQIKEDTDEIYLLPVIPVITENSVLTNNRTSVTGLTINSLTEPDVINTTGEILYIENRLPINRQADQVEKIRTVINF